MGCVGLDIGGTKILAGILQEGSLKTERCPTPKTSEALWHTVHEFIRALTSDQPLTGVGIAIAGIEQENGHCWTPNTPALDGVALQGRLAECYGVPVVVDNDARLALLAESHLGAAQGVDDVLLVSIGTGIGGSFLTQGRLLRGAHGTAGSLGWLQIPTAQGGWDLWENRASARALEDQARQAGWESARALVHSVQRDSDPQALHVLQGWMALLGAGIASWVSAFDPDLVLLTGGITQDAEWLLAGVSHQVQQQASCFTRNTPIRLSRWGACSPLRGALWSIHEIVQKGSPLHD